MPHGEDMSVLWPLLPVFLSYVLSFVFVGIYWNNHHHLMHAVTRVSGGVLWANLHLLFWLSLLPFVTGWMGENHFAKLPSALYGVVLLMAAVAYSILTHAIIREEGPELAACEGSRQGHQGQFVDGVVRGRNPARLPLSMGRASDLRADRAYMARAG